MMEDRYISRRVVATSYRPGNALMSPGLKRAREPFFWRNAVTGTLLFTFGVGVWAYSISAVKQDTFEDIDEEARILQRGASRVEDRGSGSPAADEATTNAQATSLNVESNSSGAEVHAVPIKSRGLLAPLLDEYVPSLLDPTRRTVVWGAPPVDSIGRVSDTRDGK